ncbi:hypothetical protein AB1N83_011675, partial [Pleurotus pulmonarius]
GPSIPQTRIRVSSGRDHINPRHGGHD